MTSQNMSIYSIYLVDGPFMAVARDKVIYFLKMVQCSIDKELGIYPGLFSKLRNLLIGKALK